MKYLKTYENIFRKKEVYEVGDFVEIDVHINYVPTKGKISKKLKYTRPATYCITFPYDNCPDMYLIKKDIIRKLTPEEIEEYKLERDTKKYNL
jgi:hypothetical protein